eukprot:5242554-Prymnesium_polylepis.1
MTFPLIASRERLRALWAVCLFVAHGRVCVLVRQGGPDGLPMALVRRKAVLERYAALRCLSLARGTCRRS